jgi:hypothetical protein
MICCCTAAEAAERTKERPLLEDVSCQSAQKMIPKAVLSKKSKLQFRERDYGTMEGLDCDICCSEPGFACQQDLLLIL